MSWNLTNAKLPRVKFLLPLALAIALASHSPNIAMGLSCAADAIQVFPPSGQIPPNVVIVLQGKGGAGNAIDALTADGVVLKGAGKDFPVRFVEHAKPYFSHLIFEPAEGLLPEGPIELHVRRQADGSEPRWDLLARWVVVPGVDRTSPEVSQDDLKVALKAGDTSWGEAVSVTFPVTASEMPILYLAKVEESERESPTGKAVEIFLQGTYAVLYRDACGMNHHLTKGQQYLVDLIPIDAAGNRGRPTGQSFVIQVPLFLGQTDLIEVLKR